MFKDFVGKPVEVGDTIFYATTGRYSESRVLKITRFSKKFVFGKVLKTNRPAYGVDCEVIVKNVFVKLCGVKEEDFIND